MALRCPKPPTHPLFLISRRNHNRIEGCLDSKGEVILIFKPLFKILPVAVDSWGGIGAPEAILVRLGYLDGALITTTPPPPSVFTSCRTCYEEGVDLTSAFSSPFPFSFLPSLLSSLPLSSSSSFTVLPYFLPCLYFSTLSIFYLYFFFSSFRLPISQLFFLACFSFSFTFILYILPPALPSPNFAYFIPLVLS